MKLNPALLALVSGLLLFAAWPVSPLTFLIFFAFVPIFWMEAQGVSFRKFFIWIYVTMLIWNVSTTWWIINSTVPGAIATFLANSLLMCIPWIGFYRIKRRMGSTAGYLSFIFFWLTFEYIHLNWELSWPWLTLGNVFASQPKWVQWYEYTGVPGGSLWILVTNLLVFLFIKRYYQRKFLPVRVLSILLAVVAAPLIISLMRFQLVFKGRTPHNIVAIQPNVDPYEKFEPGNEYGQLQKLIAISESKIDTATRLLVWPETAIPLAINEDQVNDHPFLQPVRELLKRHPELRLLTGIEGFRIFDAETKTKYAHAYGNSGLYYEAYNSAALFDTAGVQLYHKSKLVPGVEALPSFLTFLNSWFEQFGGTAGGYARQEERTVLIPDNSEYKIAPAICYESIYGEFMTGFIRNGGNLIAIITNDGWWGETPGFRQHKQYAGLRAIETRCWIVRSANTGISCFIDPQGNIYQAQPWNISSAIKQSLPVGTGKKTFYVNNGDYISKAAVGLTIVMLIWNIFVIIKQRRNAKAVSTSQQKN